MNAAELVAHALKARKRAYAPYSGYLVGSAVLAADGAVIYGCNVENAAYPSTICAERVALTGAVAQGKRDLIAIAVATKDGGSPCGPCRQVMIELAPQLVIYISDEHGNFRVTTIQDLLPDSFTAQNLEE
jgi:cytidine deaminase